jgi:ferritin-like metal-binding protein YciE
MSRLVKYLTDVHSIECQALVQMELAPRLVRDGLAADFHRHREETAEHERLIRARLEAHGAAPARPKDVAGWLGGVGMVLFARSQPDTPGKLVFHAHSYEHMELAAYELLERVAIAAGDPETAAVARAIATEERQMAERIAGRFDEAVAASFAALGDPDPGAQLDKYLGDAHALERQSRQFLERGRGVAGSAELAAIFEEHLEETLAQTARLDERLAARGASPSPWKDAALRFGGLNLVGFFAAQPDTPPKLAGFAFALEQLEVGGYELLARVAARAGDAETVATARQGAAEERRAADRIATTWDAVLDQLDDVAIAPAAALAGR